MLPVLVRWARPFCAALYCAAPPYTAPGLNAACFGEMGVGVWAMLPWGTPPRLG